MAGQLSPADIAELTRLTFRYAHAIDRDQPELLRDVFIDDAIIEFHLLAGAPVIRFDGVSSFINRPLERYRSQHYLTNHEFDAETERARGICYLLGQHWLPENPADMCQTGARYEDICVRTPAGWRIAERRCYFTWTQGNLAVLGGLR